MAQTGIFLTRLQHIEFHQIDAPTENEKQKCFGKQGHFGVVTETVLSISSV